MSGAEIAMVSVFTPLSLALLGTLYRLGSIMGRIDEKLGDHDRRLDDLEGVLHRRPFATGGHP